MLETQSRRINDVRMDNLEINLASVKTVVSDIKIKIFNGFDKSIKSTEEKVKYIDIQNNQQHNEIKIGVENLSKKFDHMLWFLVSSSISIASFLVVCIIKGWL